MVVDIRVGSRSQDDILVDMTSLENVHESNDLRKKKDSLPLENFGLFEGFSHLKSASNATSLTFVVVQRVTSKSISQDLALQIVLNLFQ